jgi:pimeloyl-ACP methyl ester carboxylesterase
MLMPLPFLLGWLIGLASVLLFGAGVYWVWAWATGMLLGVGWLVGGVLSLAWSLLGRHVVLAFFPRGTDDPKRLAAERSGRVQGTDGSVLHVELDGPPQASPLVVLTHGWGLDGDAWYYVRRRLGAKYRLVAWDLPGLGRSTQPRDGRYSVQRLAEDLRAVIAAYADGRPVVLVGHSIGGMTMFTLCRTHPGLLGREVQGLVFVDTSHVWPLRTVIASDLQRLLRWPVLEPLLLLTRVLWPLVWLMNVNSYLNGSAHLVNRFTSFGPGVTRGQLDFSARYTAKGKPSVVAKGLQAVLRWDESGAPPRLRVPLMAITGTLDRVTKPAALRDVSRTAPDADLVEIARAGHLGLLQDGQAYARAIEEAIERAVGRSSEPSAARRTRA